MTDDLTATTANIRSLHSFVIDAVIEQDADIFTAVVHRLGGLSCRAFVRAVSRTGTARIVSAVEHDTLVYRVEIRGDDDEWHLLVRPPAALLGFEDTPDLRDKEIAFHTERLLREMTGEDQ